MMWVIIALCRFLYVVAKHDKRNAEVGTMPYSYSEVSMILYSGIGRTRQSGIWTQRKISAASELIYLFDFSVENMQKMVENWY